MIETMLETHKNEINSMSTLKFHERLQETQTLHQMPTNLFAFKDQKDKDKDKPTLKIHPLKKAFHFSKSVSSLFNLDPKNKMVRENQTPKKFGEQPNSSTDSHFTHEADRSKAILENFPRYQDKRHQASNSQNSTLPRKLQYQPVIQTTLEQKAKNTTDFELQCSKIKFGNQKITETLKKQQSQPKQSQAETSAITQTLNRPFKQNETKHFFANSDTNDKKFNTINATTKDKTPRSKKLPKSVSYDGSNDLKTQTIDRRFMGRYQTSEDDGRSSSITTHHSDYLDLPTKINVTIKEAFKSKSNLKTFKSESNLRSLSSNRPPQLPPRNDPFKKSRIKRISLLRQDFEYFQLDFSKIDYKGGLISSYSKDFPYVCYMHPNCLLHRAGVVLGDYLTEVNGRSMEGMLQPRMVELLNKEHKFLLKIATVHNPSTPTKLTTLKTLITPIKTFQTLPTSKCLKPNFTKSFSEENHYEVITLVNDEKNDRKSIFDNSGNSDEKNQIKREKYILDDKKELDDRINEKEKTNWNAEREKKRERWKNEIGNNSFENERHIKNKITFNIETSDVIDNNKDRRLKGEEDSVELRSKRHGCVFAERGKVNGKQENVILNVQNSNENKILNRNEQFDNFPTNLYLATNMTTANNYNNRNTKTSERVISSNSSGFISEENISDGSIPSNMSTDTFNNTVYPVNTTVDFKIANEHSVELQENRFSKGTKQLEIFDPKLHQSYPQQQFQKITTAKQQKLKRHSAYNLPHMTTQFHKVTTQLSNPEEQQNGDFSHIPPPLPPKSYTLGKSFIKYKSDYYNKNNKGVVISINTNYDDNQKEVINYKHNKSKRFDGFNNEIGFGTKCIPVPNQSVSKVLNPLTFSHPTDHASYNPTSQHAISPKSTSTTPFNNHKDFTDHTVIVNVKTGISKKNGFSNATDLNSSETDGKVSFQDFDEGQNNLFVPKNEKMYLKQDLENKYNEDFNNRNKDKYSCEKDNFNENSGEKSRYHIRFHGSSDNLNNKAQISTFPTSVSAELPFFYPQTPSSLQTPTLQNKKTFISQSPTTTTHSPTLQTLKPSTNLHSTLQIPQKLATSLQPPKSSSLISSTLFLTPPSEFLNLEEVDFEIQKKKYRKEKILNKPVMTSEKINVNDFGKNNLSPQETHELQQHESFTSNYETVDKENINFIDEKKSYHEIEKNVIRNPINDSPPPLPPRKIKSTSSEPAEKKKARKIKDVKHEMKECQVIEKESTNEIMKKSYFNKKESGVRIEDIWCVDESEVGEKILKNVEIEKKKKINKEKLKERKIEIGKVEEWGVEDVCDWLESISFKRFTSEFKSKNVDGTFLLQLKRKDLVGMGMFSLEIRRDFERALLRIKMFKCPEKKMNE